MDRRKPRHGPYQTADWQRRRAAQLSAEPLCRMCAADGRVTAALVADHIRPHKGDTTQFWQGELQSLCKHCHDSRKARIERGGTDPGCDADGVPLDPTHHWRA